MAEDQSAFYASSAQAEGTAGFGRQRTTEAMESDIRHMKPSLFGRGAAALIACAVLPLGIAACSSSSSGSGGGNAAGSPSTAAASPTTAPTSTSPDAGLPTGTQLKADLVSTGIPAGYALDSSGSVDSGSGYQPSSAPTAGTDCTNLDGTGWVDLAGQGSVSFAQNDYIDNANSEEFAQEIDAFPGTAAQDVMTALSGITAKCPKFDDSQTSSTVKVSVTTDSSPGDGAVVITLSDSRWAGSTTLEAVRVGHSVVTVLSSADSGSAAFARTMASQIAAKLTAAGNQ